MESTKTINFLFGFNYRLYYCCFLMNKTNDLIFIITHLKKKCYRCLLQCVSPASFTGNPSLCLSSNAGTGICQLKSTNFWLCQFVNYRPAVCKWLVFKAKAAIISKAEKEIYHKSAYMDFIYKDLIKFCSVIPICCLHTLCIFFSSSFWPWTQKYTL